MYVAIERQKQEWQVYNTLCLPSFLPYSHVEALSSPVHIIVSELVWGIIYVSLLMLKTHKEMDLGVKMENYSKYFIPKCLKRGFKVAAIFNIPRQYTRMMTIRTMSKQKKAI